MKRYKDTRITITLKLSRKVIASILKTIPENVNFTNYRDIVMWNNTTAMIDAKVMSKVEADSILMSRGFFPRELEEIKEEKISDNVNRSNPLVSKVLDEMKTSK